ncbi:recombinase family protein [Lactococcus lactis]|uniref:recombinase family protein n=1 Tax=Lactococcus lactis TaxID=1358 RepID=UPI003BF5423A
MTKFDCLARNIREVLEIVQSLFNRRIKVHILNIGLIDTTPTDQLTFTILGQSLHLKEISLRAELINESISTLAKSIKPSKNALLPKYVLS